MQSADTVTSELSVDGTVRGRRATGRAALELLGTLLLFAASAAWPVPDVNETVYLTKARHAVDPAWGRGDFYLESADGHAVFFRLLGPLTAALPLPTAAWVGRWLGWLAVAVGFHHAVGPLVPPGVWRLAAAALFALGLRQTAAAGEWVLGGCEAKVFAWAAVLAASGEFTRGRWGRSWVLAGGGTAIHPLVGGWAQIALLAAAWWCRMPLLPRGGRRAAAACLAAGVALAALGVVPALSLTAGIAAAERAAAARIYVVDRLSHHLLPRTFADGLIARHVLAVFVWLLVRRVLPASGARDRSDTLTAIAVAIALAGAVISIFEPWAPAATYGLLRYYWFRLSDVFVPFSLATAAAAVLADGRVLAALGRLPAPLTRAVVLMALAADVVGQAWHWPLPGRTAPPSRADTRVDAASWDAVCRWVADHTPGDAVFLTPRGAASFTWLTGRAEVVAWKNNPQDSRALLEWRRRIADCFSRDGSLRGMVTSTAELGAERWRTVADRYGADHAIVPADTPGLDDVGWERVHREGVYAVYRRPSPASPRSDPAATKGDAPR